MTRTKESSDTRGACSVPCSHVVSRLQLSVEGEECSHSGCSGPGELSGRPESSSSPQDSDLTAPCPAWPRPQLQPILISASPERLHSSPGHAKFPFSSHGFVLLSSCFPALEWLAHPVPGSSPQVCGLPAPCYAWPSSLAAHPSICKSRAAALSSCKEMSYK